MDGGIFFYKRQFDKVRMIGRMLQNVDESELDQINKEEASKSERL